MSSLLAWSGTSWLTATLVLGYWYHGVRFLLQVLLVLWLLFSGELLTGGEICVVLGRMPALPQDLHEVLTSCYLGESVGDLLLRVRPPPDTFRGLHALVDDGNFNARALLRLSSVGAVL